MAGAGQSAHIQEIILDNKLNKLGTWCQNLAKMTPYVPAALCTQVQRNGKTNPSHSAMRIDSDGQILGALRGEAVQSYRSVSIARQRLNQTPFVH